MDEWEKEAELLVKGAAWVKKPILEDVQDDWDVSLSSEEEQKATTIVADNTASSEQQVLTRREQRRLQVQRESEDIFSGGSKDVDEVEREKQIRMADLSAGIDLLRLRVSEEEKTKIVESSISKKGVNAGTSSAAIGGRKLDTPKDVDDCIRTLVRDLSALSSSRLYPTLLEGLFRELATTRETPEIRRLASTLTDLAASKQKSAGRKKPQIELGGKKGGVRNYEDDAGDDHLEDDY